MPEQTDIHISSFPDAESITSADKVTGLQGNVNKNFTFSSILAWFVNAVKSAFVPVSRTINGKGLSSNISLNASDVGAQNKITANGILKGDGQGGVSAATAGTDYQAPLTFDNAPTANSNNPVKSGGVYSDVRTRVPNYGKGENLLDNAYFVGGGTGRGVFPVNQRGKSSYTGLVYGIDRWESLTTGGTLTIGADYITLQAAAYNFNWRQKLSRKIPIGSAVTLTVIKGDGSLVTGSGILSSSTSFVQVDVTSGYIRAYYDYVQVTTGVGATNTIKEIWLELGTEMTCAHQENGTWVPNEIPDYEEELIKCQTSTADPSDTYANKSFATQQDLTSIQATGTTNTTGAAIPAGAYFYLNGVLNLAKTQIDVNAMFTPGTNCEQTTLSSQIRLEVLTVTTNSVGLVSAGINVSTGKILAAFAPRYEISIYLSSSGDQGFFVKNAGTNNPAGNVTISVTAVILNY